jgi:hypothetical protein
VQILDSLCSRGMMFLVGLRFESGTMVLDHAPEV